MYFNFFIAGFVKFVCHNDITEWRYTKRRFCFYFFLEIPDFLSPEEADHIIDVAYGDGFYKSDIHLDPVAKDHAKTLRSTEGKEKRNSDIDRLISC